MAVSIVEARDQGFALAVDCFTFDILAFRISSNVGYASVLCGYKLSLGAFKVEREDISVI